MHADSSLMYWSLSSPIRFQGTLLIHERRLRNALVQTISAISGLAVVDKDSNAASREVWTWGHMHAHGKDSRENLQFGFSQRR